MKYYITSPEMANGISHIKAMQEGCSGMTQFWWEIISHPTQNLSAIIFNDFEIEKANTENNKILYQNPPDKPVFNITTNDVVDYQYMVDNGWFIF